MSSRKTVNVYSVSGAQAGSAPLPKVFDTPVRGDLVQLIYTNLAKNQQQPHGTSPTAGVRPSAVSWGPGRAKARVPRVNGSGSNRNGQGAYANFCRGGHRFQPPTTQRRWFRPVPVKQRRYAVASAIAASAVAALVEARGHRIKELAEIPVVVANDVQKIQKTKEAVAFLKAIKAYADVEKVINGKYNRSSKGSMRRSAFKTKKGPLVVYNKDEGIVKAFRNIPGVDIQCVTRLSLYQLAPGAVMGRLVIWTGFAMNFFVVAMAQIVRVLPAAGFWDGGEHFDYIFGLAPRVTLASLLAFLSGSTVNAYIMSRMKVASHGKRFSLRAVVSSIGGETVDSLVFFPIAFWGLAMNEMLKMMLLQIFLKTAYEVIILPVTNIVVKAVKRYEGADAFDTDISYNPFKITDIQ